MEEPRDIEEKHHVLLNRIVRGALSETPESKTRPSRESLDAFLRGDATSEQENEVLTAALSSAEFRWDLIGLLEDLLAIRTNRRTSLDLLVEDATNKPLAGVADERVATNRILSALRQAGFNPITGQHQRTRTELIIWEQVSDSILNGEEVSFIDSNALRLSIRFDVAARSFKIRAQDSDREQSVTVRVFSPVSPVDEAPAVGEVGQELHVTIDDVMHGKSIRLGTIAISPLDSPTSPTAADPKAKRRRFGHDIEDRLPPHIEIVEHIGEGGFATVYKVYNARLKTEWALKAFKSHALGSGSRLPNALREARIMAMTNHANIVTVHDVDPENGLIFMEYLSGGSLMAKLKSGVRNWDEFKSLGTGILEGLAAAHDRGIQHGDLSPGNVLLTSEGTPKLVDFGFARHVEFSSVSIGATVGFAAPEHLMKKPITNQSDVFCAGQILFQLATGTHPFDWQDFVSYSYAAIFEDPKDPVFLFTPPSDRLESLLRRALAREQGARYPSARRMLEAFRQIDSRSKPTPGIGPGKNKAEEHYHKGLEYYKGSLRQDMDWAEEEFQTALKHDPRFWLAYVGLADVAVFRHMSYFDRSTIALAKAEHYCMQALDINAEESRAYRSLGRICMTRRDFAAARQHFEKAVALDPDFREAFVSLGWCNVEAHDLAAAEAAAKAAKVISEDSLDVLELLARVFYYQKEYEQSIAAAREAVVLYRRSGRAYYDLAMAQRALGNFRESRANFAKSQEFRGDPNTTIDYAITELLDGKLTEALALAERATNEEGFQFLASYYSGFIHNSLGNRDRAGEFYARARDLSTELSRQNPMDPYPKIVLAMALAALGDAARSEAHSILATELDPQDGLVAFYAACAQSHLGDQSKTEELLHRALSLPRSPSKLEATFDPHFSQPGR